MTGSLRSGRNLHYCGHLPDEDCDACGAGVPATKHHVLWGCPSTADVRAPYLEALAKAGFNAEADDWQGTAALRLCGVCVEDPRVFELQCQLAREHDVVEDRIALEDISEEQEGGEWVRRDPETNEEYSQMFLDGPCRMQSHSRFRRAAYACFSGTGHVANYEGPLYGVDQTAPRSEVRALLGGTRRAFMRTEFCTGCEYVETTMTKLLEGKENEVRKGEHGDLRSKTYSEILRHEDPKHFKIRKVKGHSTQEMVDSGLMEQGDKDRNDEVDHAAVRQAELRVVDQAIIDDALKRARVTGLIQAVVVDVYTAY